MAHVPPIVPLPSGKHTKNYGKSPFLMGKLTISMAIFNSYGTNYQRVISEDTKGGCQSHPDANHGAGIYLPTKLGDFGQGQMLVNIPAPWSIWAISINHLSLTFPVTVSLPAGIYP